MRKNFKEKGVENLFVLLFVSLGILKLFAHNDLAFSRRGYCTEKQKGLLIVEKLDYLQSKVLQEIFGLVSKPLLTAGLWIKEVLAFALVLYLQINPLPHSWLELLTLYPIWK